MTYSKTKFWMAALCLLIASASSATTPTWYPPIYLELSEGWKADRETSDDSQVFVLSKGRQRIIFDYGLGYGKEDGSCQIQEISKIVDLNALKCVSHNPETQKTKISFSDPEDGRYRLSVFIPLNFVETSSTELIALLKTIQFVGKRDLLKLVSVERSSNTAIVIDETGRSRRVKRGDVVLRNYGTVTKIGRDRILIDEYVLSAGGDFKRKKITLRVSEK